MINEVLFVVLLVYFWTLAHRWTDRCFRLDAAYQKEYMDGECAIYDAA
jgi:hypothetical protein